MQEHGTPDPGGPESNPGLEAKRPNARIGEALYADATALHARAEASHLVRFDTPEHQTGQTVESTILTFAAFPGSNETKTLQLTTHTVAPGRLSARTVTLSTGLVDAPAGSASLDSVVDDENGKQNSRRGARYIAPANPQADGELLVYDTDLMPPNATTISPSQRHQVLAHIPEDLATLTSALDKYERSTADGGHQD